MPIDPPIKTETAALLLAKTQAIAAKIRASAACRL